jgi:hypothetical protein
MIIYIFNENNNFHFYANFINEAKTTSGSLLNFLFEMKEVTDQFCLEKIKFFISVQILLKEIKKLKRCSKFFMEDIKPIFAYHNIKQGSTSVPNFSTNT